MRIIHTADWHLGRIFHGIHLTDDQAYVLEQFLSIVKDIRPDVIVVSGDIYDRAIPPYDAVSLLDEVISRLVRDVGCKVVMIAGNHDSPERLSFGSKLFENSNLYILGRFSNCLLPIQIEDEFGLVNIYAIPFLEPAIVREELNNEEITTHERSLRAILDIIGQNKPKDKRSLLVAHAAVIGGQCSDSERPISIGGTQTVDPSIFQGFNYVALGHLHQPQSISKPYIQYAGSILKYSFSEAHHKKSITFVEMDAYGNCNINRIPLVPRYDLRIVKGRLEEIIQNADNDPNKDDYIKVILLDENPVLNAMSRLRKVYPNTLHIERANIMLPTSRLNCSIDHNKLSEQEIFSSFFHHVTGEVMKDNYKTMLIKILNKLEAKDREAFGETSKA